MTSRVLNAALVLIATLPCCQAGAEVIRYRFTGEVFSVRNQRFLPEGTPVGSVVEGSFSFSTDAPSIDLPGAISGFLQSPAETLSVSILDSEYRANGQFISTVQNIETNPGVRDFSLVLSDGITAAARGTSSSGVAPSQTGESILVNDTPVAGSIAIGFDQLGATNLDPFLSLPTTIAPEALFGASGQIVIDSTDPLEGGRQAIVSFSITSVTLVPEPGAAAIAFVCFSLLASSRLFVATARE